MRVWKGHIFQNMYMYTLCINTTCKINDVVYTIYNYLRKTFPHAIYMYICMYLANKIKLFYVVYL